MVKIYYNIHRELECVKMIYTDTIFHSYLLFNCLYKQTRIEKTAEISVRLFSDAFDCDILHLNYNLWNKQVIFKDQKRKKKGTKSRQRTTLHETNRLVLGILYDFRRLTKTTIQFKKQFKNYSMRLLSKCPVYVLFQTHKQYE